MNVLVFVLCNITNRDLYKEDIYIMFIEIEKAGDMCNILEMLDNRV